MYKEREQNEGRVESRFSMQISAADAEKATFDHVCKQLLANKRILAHILKACANEYAECSVEEIERKYIEGIPRIAVQAVHMDEAVAADTIRGCSNEDASVNEGRVTYDIIFDALLPPEKQTGHSQTEASKNNDMLSVIVNVEAQDHFYPGYPVVKRGIYYGSRMISSQYGTIFTKSHYEKIRKVYSIWICIMPPKHRENSINIYSLKEERLLGNVTEKKENYDLMDVAMVCLARDRAEETDGIIKLLSVLLSRQIKSVDKKRILETEFGIEMTRKMDKEVNEMGGYADWIERQGIEKGRLLSLRSLMANMKWTPEQAMDALGIPEEERDMYEEELEQ